MLVDETEMERAVALIVRDVACTLPIREKEVLSVAGCRVREIAGFIDRSDQIYLALAEESNSGSTTTSSTRPGPPVRSAPRILFG